MRSYKLNSLLNPGVLIKLKRSYSTTKLQMRRTRWNGQASDESRRPDSPLEVVRLHTPQRVVGHHSFLAMHSSVVTGVYYYSIVQHTLPLEKGHNLCNRPVHSCPLTQVGSSVGVPHMAELFHTGSGCLDWGVDSLMGEIQEEGIRLVPISNHLKQNLLASISS